MSCGRCIVMDIVSVLACLTVTWVYGLPCIRYVFQCNHMLTGLKSCKNVVHSACVQPAAPESASVPCFSPVNSLHSSLEVNTTTTQHPKVKHDMWIIFLMYVLHTLLTANCSVSMVYKVVYKMFSYHSLSYRVSKSLLHDIGWVVTNKHPLTKLNGCSTEV